MGLTFASSGCGESAPAPHHPDPKKPPGGCDPGQVSVDGGGCEPAGIPASACADGFESDGDGSCNAILPDAPCLDGQIAVPGETRCHPLAPCGLGRWGDIPVEPSTVYVDASYAGSDADGSADRPWPSLVDATSAAPEGAMVAMADGSYEPVLLQGKPLRLWGRCPASVTIAGTDGGFAAVDVRSADGVEIHALGITGPKIGIAITGSTGVLLDEVWIHDTAGAGMFVTNALGAAAVTVHSTLVEGTHDFAIRDEGSELTLEGSVVRETEPNGGPGHGIAIAAIDGQTKTGRANLTLRGSIVEQSRLGGIVVGSSDATIEASVVRDILVDASGHAGTGIVLDQDPKTGEGAIVTMRSSIVERTHDLGIAVLAGEATLDAIAVRDISPADDQRFGRGIYVQENRDTGERSTLTLTRSAIDRAHDMGVVALGSDAKISATRVRDTQLRLDIPIAGLGIGLALGAHHAQPADMAIEDCAVEGNTSNGILAFASKLSVAHTLVRGTLADGADVYGDGIGLADEANVTVTTTRIEGSMRAAIASFSGNVSIADTTLECNTLDLDGEVVGGKEFGFTDGGGNVCGCEGQSRQCKVLSSSLAAPKPISPH